MQESRYPSPVKPIHAPVCCLASKNTPSQLLLLLQSNVRNGEPQKCLNLRKAASLEHLQLLREKQLMFTCHVWDKNCLVLTVTVNTAGNILWVRFEPENQVITPGLKIPAELPADPNCNFHLKAKFLFGQMGKVLANHFTVSQTALLN